jgi:carnosine N-methyltransferase
MANDDFIQRILSIQYVFQNNSSINYSYLYDKAISQLPHNIEDERLSRVKSTIKQCVRDWSDEGENERKESYHPILNKLIELYPDYDSRAELSILVPGSGLSRLVWDIANLNFNCQGNEFSYYMLLCSYLILNFTPQIKQFTLFPYIYETKNLYDTAHQFRSVQLPNINPNNLPKTAKFSMVAGDFMDSFAEFGNEQDRKAKLAQGISLKPNLTHKQQYDCIASCFFLDCSNNIMETLRTCNYILKLGGYLINFGPLLYHYSGQHGQTSIELSYEELKSIFPVLGFDLIEERLHCSAHYSTDNLSMMQQQYKAVFFVLKKVKEDQIEQLSIQEITEIGLNNAANSSFNNVIKELASERREKSSGPSDTKTAATGNNGKNNKYSSNSSSSSSKAAV